MKYTGNYNLKKPEGSDVVNIEDLNDNADIIDAELKKLNDAIKDLDADGITLPDGKTISEKFEEIETEIGNIEELDTDTKINVIAAINEIYQEIVAHKAENVQQFEEIYNRLSKLKGNDIQARREILDIKLKLDEMEVVDYLNKTGIGFYDLFENIEYIDMLSTTATVDTASADVIFTGQESLKMLPQKFDESINNIELAIYDIDRESYQVDNSVSNSAQIQITIYPGKINVGDKYYYNGEVYEVTGVSEA